MKLGILIFLLSPTMAFPGISSIQTWLASFQQPIQNFIDNPLRKSTIPLFILDTRHPWIISNQRKLERLPNAEAFLCSLPESKEADIVEVEQDLEIPDDLFDTLFVDNNRVGTSRPGWPNALERLSEMKKCPRALKQVKTLQVNVYVYEGPHTDQVLRLLEPAKPPEHLIALFGDVLEAMTSLKTLRWNIRKEDTDLFGTAFTSRNLTLPSITHLEPGPSSQYLVGMCANLVTLKNGGSYSWFHGYMPDDRDWGLMFIQSAALAPKLKEFSMEGGHRGWSSSYVSEVVKAIPQLEKLGIKGQLGRDYGYGGFDQRNNGVMLKAILKLLEPLENLTHVDFSSSSKLAVGFDGGPGCGNVYMGRGGQLYARQVTRQGIEATERAGDIIVANLPALKSFTIGSRQPNITFVDGKMVNATWPWTGRMKAWLLEVVPLGSEFEEDGSPDYEEEDFSVSGSEE